ncbi:hypothetical protein SeMB42_g02370 [Synchytrium endobioticum]|uniref:RanBP2-type domain-containing protein n=1 Tax=Synchytrium endobioticum TaxID=286115 RepID=A0A507DER4_9FUNG|nr:hypothetical protein SeLEV6574_g02689 [Synchytrium endobioticum]TPX50083.1 hypothetical protein SeMB42_g02370 [Synchytrium endobioticum]
MTAASRAADALNSDDFNLPPSYNDRLPSYYEIVDTHGISHDDAHDVADMPRRPSARHGRAPAQTSTQSMHEHRPAWMTAEIEAQLQNHPSSGSVTQESEANSWQCVLCTYRNHGDFGVCQLCNQGEKSQAVVARNHQPTPNQTPSPEPSRRRSNSTSSTSLTSSSSSWSSRNRATRQRRRKPSPAPKGWSCLDCTAINPWSGDTCGENIHCDGCGIPIQVVEEGLLLGDDTERSSIGVSSSSPSAGSDIPSSASMIDGGQVTWQCTQCTLENSIIVEECAACGAAIDTAPPTIGGGNGTAVESLLPHPLPLCPPVTPSAPPSLNQNGINYQKRMPRPPPVETAPQSQPRSTAASTNPFEEPIVRTRNIWSSIDFNPFDDRHSVVSSRHASGRQSVEAEEETRVRAEIDREVENYIQRTTSVTGSGGGHPSQSNPTLITANDMLQNNTTMPVNGSLKYT